MIKKYSLKLDKDFSPAIYYVNEFKKAVIASNNYKTITLVVERSNGYNESYNLNIFNSDEMFNENIFFIERISKSLLWIYGGYKLTVVGDYKIYEALKNIYLNGERLFDSQFMSQIYLKNFEVNFATEMPEIKKETVEIGKHLNGNRIGFDAGGSDMKVSAVIDGQSVFSEEIVWFPKLNSDPLYHKKHIREAILKAVEYLPKVEALGVSSAGVYVDNEARVASLFIKVEKNDFEQHIKNIYIDVAKELNVPLVVANDGDVTALAGAMTLGKNKLLGIAMGTSEAAGYVNGNGNIAGWLNELAFVPVDFNKSSMVDEWSGDYGCGLKYFSQDAVIKLAEAGGYEFPVDMPLAERLKTVQKLGKDNELFQEIFKTIGIYLGFTLAWYSEFYDIEELLLLGRVMSGDGGNIIVEEANNTLKNEFPELAEKINISLPDEKFRRLGQSVAAASLVNL